MMLDSDDSSTPLAFKKSKARWAPPVELSDDSGSPEGGARNLSSAASLQSSDTDDWGHDAVLEWGGAWEGDELARDAESNLVDLEVADDDEPEVHDIDAISDDENSTRGTTMPMYVEWDTARLQVRFPCPLF